MSQELNKQLEQLEIKEAKKAEQEEAKDSSPQQDQQPQEEVKKKKVVKSVRFNLEIKKATQAEKIAKENQEQQPQNESKGLFPATLPEQNKEENQTDLKPALESYYTDEEINEMEQIKAWLFNNIKRDIDNANAKGANCVQLKVKNFVLLRKDDNQLYNRVEFDTTFDFTTIEQILLSPEEAHPTQSTLKYCTVVLFGKNKNVPLVFPYCYQKHDEIEEIQKETEQTKNKKEKKKLQKKLKKKMGNYTPNELDNWIFVNSNLKEAFHKINSFQSI
ncbi:hypothetical protein ABPG74_022660 [Tetrahymena malaccensis]